MISMMIIICYLVKHHEELNIYVFKDFGKYFEFDLLNISNLF